MGRKAPTQGHADFSPLPLAVGDVCQAGKPAPAEQNDRAIFQMSLNENQKELSAATRGIRMRFAKPPPAKTEPAS